LEEIDTEVDIGRLQRAIAARRTEKIEAKRMVGIQRPDALSAQEWGDVAEHDRLLEKYGQ
jgi:hypothetical protein